MLAAAAAELQDLLLRLEALRRSDAPDDRDLYVALSQVVRAYVSELRAELTGGHLRCHATQLDLELFEHALSRASSGAARERASVH
jgi:hypothetical protein